MCMSEDAPPRTVRTDSTISSSDSATEEADWGEAADQTNNKNFSLSSAYEDDNLLRSNVLLSVFGGLVVASGMCAFSLWFPFFLAPHAATKTYDWAYYSYDPQLSHFDNSAWTYGTDYALAVVMAALGFTILRHSRQGVSDKLCNRAASLLFGYCVSVLAGGMAHQHYTTSESRNSLSFRFLWTVCVGTVTAASCSMGNGASECVQSFQKLPGCSPWVRKMPVIPDSFWWAFGLSLTMVCALGGISFQRPACDIFIAGITQSPPTFYQMTFLFLVQHSDIPMWVKASGNLGFILNAPLLPMYPLLVQYTDWSLASVNTLLHCWLCVAWSLQGYSLLCMIKVLNRTAVEKKIN